MSYNFYHLLHLAKTFKILEVLIKFKAWNSQTHWNLTTKAVNSSKKLLTVYHSIRRHIFMNKTVKTSNQT